MPLTKTIKLNYLNASDKFISTKNLCFLLFMLFVIPLLSQNEPCGFNHKLDLSLKNDEYFKEELKEQNRIWAKTKYQFLNDEFANTVDTIPVVVHILHVGEAIGEGSNISDAQIHSAINNLNEVFDASGRYEKSVEMGLYFTLARYKPNGSPFDGIVRKNASDITVLGDNYPEKGITDNNENTVKNFSIFPDYSYLNIWIVNKIDGKNDATAYQGFAYIPNGPGKRVSGPVILHNAFGFDPVDTAGYELKTETPWNITTIHEIGHAFGLYHTFQGDEDGKYCPDEGNNCYPQGDCCEDTPTHKRGISCTRTDNEEECLTIPLGNVSENFMSYSSNECQVLFTADQRSRMHNIIEEAKPCLINSIGLTGIKIECDEDKVWPGDLNNDGIVDAHDYLSLLMRNSDYEGCARDSITAEWKGFSAIDFPFDKNSPFVNNKYLDANGDGIVNGIDIKAINYNYNKIRPSYVERFGGNLPFHFQFEPTQDAPPEQISFDVYLKTDLDTIDGIAISFYYGDKAIGKGLDVSKSLLGNKIIKNNSEKNSFDIACTEFNSFDFDSIPIARIFALKSSFDTLDISSTVTARSVNFDAKQGRIIIVESVGTDTIYTAREVTTHLHEADFIDGSSGLAVSEDTLTLLLCATVEHADCNGFGSIALQPMESEIDKVQYRWNTGDTTKTLTNLIPGTYTVTATPTNINKASFIYDYEVKNNAFNCPTCPKQLVLPTTQSQGVRRAGSQIIASNQIPSNGNVVYQAGKSIILKPGFHVKTGGQFLAAIEACTTIKQKDSNSQLNTDCGLDFLVYDVIKPTCDSTGSFSVRILNGTPDYVVRLQNHKEFVHTDERFKTDEFTITGIVPDNYTLNIIDTEGNRETKSLNMESSCDDFTFHFNNIKPDSCNKSNGGFTIIIDKGVSRYNVQIMRPSGSLINANLGKEVIDAVNFAAGTYQITITDSAGNTKTKSITIPEDCSDNLKTESASRFSNLNSSNEKIDLNVKEKILFTTDIEVNFSQTLIDVIDSHNYPYALITAAPAPKPMNKELFLGVFPNPMNTSATIVYDLPTISKVNLNILDLQGRLIQNLVNQQNRTKGKNQFKWNRGDIPKGMYLLHLQTETAIQTTKMVILD